MKYITIVPISILVFYYWRHSEILGKPSDFLDYFIAGLIDINFNVFEPAQRLGSYAAALLIASSFVFIFFQILKGGK